MPFHVLAEEEFIKTFYRGAGNNSNSEDSMECDSFSPLREALVFVPLFFFEIRESRLLWGTEPGPTGVRCHGL